MIRVYFLMMAALVMMCTGCGDNSDGDYMIVKGDNGAIYRTNRKTGETVMIRGTTMKPVHDYKPPPQNARVVRSLSRFELSKLSGRGGVGAGSLNDYFSGKIYNGNSNIELTSIRLVLTHLQKDGAKYNREYKYDFPASSGKALSSSSFSFTIVRGDEQSNYQYPWNIASATGVEIENAHGSLLDEKIKSDKVDMFLAQCNNIQRVLKMVDASGQKYEIKSHQEAEFRADFGASAQGVYTFTVHDGRTFDIPEDKCEGFLSISKDVESTYYFSVDGKKAEAVPASQLKEFFKKYGKRS